jgi:hypothetical protein
VRPSAAILPNVARPATAGRRAAPPPRETTPRERYISAYLDRGTGWLYLTRTNTPQGLVGVEASALQATAENLLPDLSCPALGNGQIVSLQKSGSMLTAQTLTDWAVTHMEHTKNVTAQCASYPSTSPGTPVSPAVYGCLDCSPSPQLEPCPYPLQALGRDRCATYRCDAVSMPVAGLAGERRILAVACGHANNPVANHPDGEGAVWRSRLNQGMISLYDVPSGPSSPSGPPADIKLMRLGFTGQDGHVVSVKWAELGPAGNRRPFLFVGDLGGAVHVFDVLDPCLPPLAKDCAPSSALEPMYSWPAPKSTWFEGQPHNVGDVQVEVAADFMSALVYVANGGAGLTVLHFSMESGLCDLIPALLSSETIDTPGFSTGIAPVRDGYTGSEVFNSFILSDTSGSGLKYFTR